MVAAVAAAVLAGAGVAIAVSTIGARSSPLASMTPEQILARAVAVAGKARSERVTVIETPTPGQGASTRATFTLAGGKAAITLSLTGAGAPANSTISFIVVAGTTYMRSSSAVFYVEFGATRDVGRWLEVPADGTSSAGLDGLPTPSRLAAALSLRGPLTEVARSASTVSLGGAIPTNSLTTGDGAGDPATLVISASAPYYPLRLTFSDRTNGTQVYAFSDWGADFHISAPKNPIIEKPGPVNPGGSTSADSADVAAQADLQTALTAAKTYYTMNNQSYAGLDPTTFASIDTGLTAVAGSQPSTTQSVISLAASPTYAVMAAWAPSTDRCWAIVDDTVTSTLDDRRGPGTVYVVVPHGTEGACTAATFAVRDKLPASVTSLVGFQSLGP